MTSSQLQDLIEIGFRRRRTIARVSITVFAVLATLSLLWPPRYRSTARILVHAGRAELLVSPGMRQGTGNDPAVVSSPVTEQDLNSETELLRSRYLIERTLAVAPADDKESGSTAAAALGYVLALPRSGYALLHGVPSASPAEIAAQELARRLSVALIKRSNVIEVSFRSADPGAARAFLGRLLDQYQELHALISHDPKAERFFHTQSELLAERLRNAEERLNGIQLQTGIADLSSERSALVGEVYALEAEHQKTAASLSATRRQIAMLEQQLSTTPKRMARESRVVQNMALQAIKPQVLRLETERAELLSRYRPDSARIREIDAKLAAARSILARENRAEVQEATTDLNPTWLALDASLAQARSQAASMGAAQSALREQVEQGRARLRSLASDALLVERSRREVDADAEAYMSYVRKGEEARAAEALNQSKILNVSVVEPPSTPLQPDFPRIPLTLAAALVLGAVLGIGAAYAEERRDPRLYSITEISRLGGLGEPLIVASRE